MSKIQDSDDDDDEHRLNDKEHNEKEREKNANKQIECKKQVEFKNDESDESDIFFFISWQFSPCANSSIVIRLRSPTHFIDENRKRRMIIKRF